MARPLQGDAIIFWRDIIQLQGMNNAVLRNQWKVQYAMIQPVFRTMNKVSIFISDYYKIICLLKYRGQGQGRLEDTFTNHKISTLARENRCFSEERSHHSRNVKLKNFYRQTFKIFSTKVGGTYLPYTILYFGLYLSYNKLQELVFWEYDKIKQKLEVLYYTYLV